MQVKRVDISIWGLKTNTTIAIMTRKNDLASIIMHHIDELFLKFLQKSYITTQVITCIQVAKKEPNVPFITRDN